jgi:hypothetical protein
MTLSGGTRQEVSCTAVRVVIAQAIVKGFILVRDDREIEGLGAKKGLLKAAIWMDRER